VQPRTVVRVVAGLTIGLAALVGLLWAMQRYLIYFPLQQLAAPPPGAREARYKTSDDLELRAWFLMSPEADGRAVIVFNGNAGNRSHRVSLGTELRDRGWSVLLVDYRGYGGNPGRPSEEGLARDAAAALSWLSAQAEVDPDRIAYFGESLGAGVAAGLAVERPPAALILRSPFTSLADVGRVHYPLLPVGALLWDRFPVIDRVARYDGPVLVAWGAADSIVPPEQSRAVATAADARAVEIPGANHNDAALLDGVTMVDAVVRFLDEHV
jgi:uncharacterized protein